jgi:4-hydroxybenzoate polyprenyltransferase
MNIGWFRFGRRSVWEFLKLVRADNLLWLALTQCLARLFLIGPKAQWETLLAQPRLAMLVGSSVCVVAAGFIINDYYDVKIDAINYPSRVVVGRTLKRRWAMFWHTVLNAAGLAIGWVVAPELCVLLLAGGVLVWLYSNQLKRLPLVGNMALGLLASVAILAVAVCYRTFTPAVGLFAGFAFFTTVIRAIIKDMADIRGDLHFGCRTLPIIWGIRRTKLFLYLLLSLFLGLSVWMVWLMQSARLAGYFLAVMPAIGLFVYRLYWADTTRAYLRLNAYCKAFTASGIAAMLLA